jgi:hypothetical protein
MGHDALLGALDAYFEALGAHDPGRLTVTEGARFTENGQELTLGRGLWATATGVPSPRAVTVADVAQQQVAGWGLVEEAGEEQVLALRLQLGHDGPLREAETLVVRPADLGRPGQRFPDALRAPTPSFHDVLEPAERVSREELVRAANGYLDGVARNDADLLSVADDCVRIENGRQTVLNASAEGFSKESPLYEGLGLTVAAQIRRGDFVYIEAIRDRIVAAIDEDRGMVLVRCVFDHPGRVQAAAHRSPFPTPNSMMVFECFKIVGGLIRHVEAVGTKLPYGMAPGWSPRPASS